MATARALPTLPFLPRHYYDSVGEICQDNRLTRLPTLGHLTHQPGKASASGLATWRLSEHGIQAQQIESRSTGHILQVGLGLPKIACPSQAHHPHALRDGGFHPGTDGRASPELGGFLLSTPLLQGVVHRLRAQRQGAWTFLALGTEFTHRTGFAHRGRKADLDGWQSEGILKAVPTARTLALSDRSPAGAASRWQSPRPQSLAQHAVANCWGEPRAPAVQCPALGCEASVAHRDSLYPPDARPGPVHACTSPAGSVRSSVHR